MNTIISKSVHYCCVCKRNSKRDKKLSFFRFPKDEERFAKWKANLQLEKILCYSAQYCYDHFRVCSLHFQEKMFAGMLKSRLKINAVPFQLKEPEESDASLKGTTAFLQSMEETEPVAETPQKHINEETRWDDIFISRISMQTLVELKSLPSISFSKPSPEDDQSAIETEEMDSSTNIRTETLCRACANTCDQCYVINSKICNFSTTIKDMMILLVPQMETELDDNDVICNFCRKILIQCLGFIDKCLRVEADRKKNGLCQTKSSDIDPVTNLQDVVIKIEEVDLIDADQNDTNSGSQNGDFDNDEETDQIMHIKSENNNDNILQNDLVNELPSSIIVHNELISANQICTDKLNDFVRILASNDVRTIQYSQDRGTTTERKRVILVGSTFKCSKCNKYFEKKWKYTRHLKGHKIFQQRKEERDRLRKQNAAERKQRRQTIVDLECKTCSEILPSVEDLELHYKIHPPFVCEKCGKGFTKRTQIYAHRAVHNDQNSYVCEVCGKSIKTRSQLRQHSLIHEITINPCEKCPKVFNNVLRLKSHLRNTHGEGRTQIWTCKECGKTFKRSTLYHMHYMQIHRRDGHRKCDVCGQGFYRSDYLKRHKKRHVLHGDTLESFKNDAGKSQTNQSGSKSTEKGDRRRSRLKKLPPGPFKCQICNKLYGKLESLKRHILSHGTSRYSCKFCSRTFVVKYQLNRHEKLHEKLDVSGKYRCGICWKRFENQEDLDQHYFTHRNSKYKCELCGESFAREHLLKDHKANVHKENVQIDNNDAEEEMRILMMKGLGTTLYNLVNAI